MSWIDGAQRNYLSSLNIRDAMVAHVEIMEEPQTQNFGEKEITRNGIIQKVPDNRVRARVTYLGGSAMVKGESSFSPAVVGTEYTLWIGKTLAGKFLEGMDYKEGADAPLMIETKWKVYRGEYGRGGHRVYEAERLSGDFSPISSSEVVPVAPEPIPIEVPMEEPTPVTDEEPTPVDTDKIQLELVTALKTLGEIDRATWGAFVQSKGIAPDQVESFTNEMVEKGLIFAETTLVKAVSRTVKLDE